MVYPCIEVTVATVGNHTVEDESSEDGLKYMKAFHAATTNIPGCSCGCWGKSDKYVDRVVHFLDYDTRKQHDVHKALIGGPAPPILDGLQSETHVYVIHPNTNNRNPVYYAPYTTITFFWGIKEDKWTELSPELFAAIANSDNSTGYIWGEIDKPVLSDPSGFASLGSGCCGILATGWRSKTQHDHDTNLPRLKNAWRGVQDACEMTDDWGTSLTVTENTGHIHSWRTPLPLKDRSADKPAPGLI